MGATKQEHQFWLFPTDNQSFIEFADSSGRLASVEPGDGTPLPGTGILGKVVLVLGLGKGLARAGFLTSGQFLHAEAQIGLAERLVHP